MRSRNGYQPVYMVETDPREKEIPWKAIGLASFLFLIGGTLLAFGILIKTGHFGPSHDDRALPLIILGSITFCPGAYMIRIAAYTWKGYRGYAYNQIPQVE